MWTLINWLIVAVIVYWITRRSRLAFDVIGHMLAATLLVTALLWSVSGADKVALWGLVSKLIPGVALIVIYCYTTWVTKK